MITLVNLLYGLKLDPLHPVSSITFTKDLISVFIDPNDFPVIDTARVEFTLSCCEVPNVPPQGCNDVWYANPFVGGVGVRFPSASGRRKIMHARPTMLHFSPSINGDDVFFDVLAPCGRPNVCSGTSAFLDDAFEVWIEIQSIIDRAIRVEGDFTLNEFFRMTNSYSPLLVPKSGCVPCLDEQSDVQVKAWECRDNKCVQLTTAAFFFKARCGLPPPGYDPPVRYPDIPVPGGDRRNLCYVFRGTRRGVAGGNNQYGLSCGSRDVSLPFGRWRNYNQNSDFPTRTYRHQDHRLNPRHSFSSASGNCGYSANYTAMLINRATGLITPSDGSSEGLGYGFTSAHCPQPCPFDCACPGYQINTWAVESVLEVGLAECSSINSSTGPTNVLSLGILGAPGEPQRAPSAAPTPPDQECRLVNIMVDFSWFARNTHLSVASIRLTNRCLTKLGNGLYSMAEDAIAESIGPTPSLTLGNVRVTEVGRCTCP